MPDLSFHSPDDGFSRDRDAFLRELLRELAGVLESRVGKADAEGFIACVGTRIGERMDAEYRARLGVDHLDLRQIASVLVDLKARIEGGFAIESITEDRIVLVNRACPFAEHVVDRETLCMMTSSVFGRIAANNQGYARIEIPEAIARGDPRCRVVIAFSEGVGGREYFG
ncbi:MAG: methanogen output domain 1-containing protein [Roseovarius sp.]